MPKLLLSAVLVVTQVLSWNASPLYLCLSADGSMGVDFGPGGCHCQRHESAGSECSLGHEGCHHHGRSEHAAADGREPCGCEHIQISEPQPATLARTVAAPDSPHQVFPPAALPVEAAYHCCPAAMGGSAHAAALAHAPCSATLAVLASVVIQC